MTYKLVCPFCGSGLNKLVILYYCSDTKCKGHDYLWTVKELSELNREDY